MDDLAGMLSQVLNDPQSMQQLQQVAASLGLNADSAAPAQNNGIDLSALSALLGGGNSQQSPSPSAGENSGGDSAALASLLSGLAGGSTAAGGAAQASPQTQTATPDLSALSSLLSGLSGGATPASEQSASPDLSALSGLLGGLTGGATPASGQSASPDLSALSGLLGGLTGGATPANGQTASPDLSALSGLLGGLTGGAQNQSADGANVAALTALLGAGQPQQQASVPGLPFDMSTLLKLQKAMSSIAGNRANVDLLLALKPRLKEQRAKKVDDAIKVMQLIQFLPLIKESGLFGNLDSGLGGLVGGLGDNISNALGGLLGGGRR